DLVTGRGTPYANLIVQNLLTVTATGTFSASSSGSSSSGSSSPALAGGALQVMAATDLEVSPPSAPIEVGPATDVGVGRYDQALESFAQASSFTNSRPTTSLSD